MLQPYGEGGKLKFKDGIWKMEDEKVRERKYV